MSYRIPHELATVLSNYRDYRVIATSATFYRFELYIKIFEKVGGWWQRYEHCGVFRGTQTLVVKHVDLLPDEAIRGGGVFIGAAKQIANDFLKDQATMLAEASGQSYQSTTDGSEKTIEANGKDIFPVTGSSEQTGANKATDTGLSSAMQAVAAAATLKGVLRNPGNFVENINDVINKSIKNTRSPSEALGNAGMHQAKSRQGLNSDERFVDRYHGPDDIAKDKTGKLTEIEAKGNNRDSKVVAKDTKNNKQGSAAKNKTRAKTVAGKTKKVGIPSNRQGGAYTQDEIDLWKEIKETDGNKRHISTHTNTETGQVKVYERDYLGNIETKLDEFKLENFDEVKQGINDHFNNLKK